MAQGHKLRLRLDYKREGLWVCLIGWGPEDCGALSPATQHAKPQVFGGKLGTDVT